MSSHVPSFPPCIYHHLLPCAVRVDSAPVAVRSLAHTQTDLEAESEDRSDEDLDEGLGSDEDSEARHADFKSAAAPETDEETVNGDSGAQARQIGFETAVGELDDIVTGMNAFVDDSRAGMDGAEVEAVGGDVQFDVDKFMSLLSGEDLM